MAAQHQDTDDHHDTEDHAPHEPGSMNIEEQEKTFAGFNRLLVIASVIILLILIFMALVNA